MTIATHSSSFLLLGDSWFPIAQGGLNRYVYELAYHLTADRDRVELCGVGLPGNGFNSFLPSNDRLTLTNLAEAERSLGRRLWSARFNWLDRLSNREKIERPDAINLHFALYSFPILDRLPDDVPLTFTFHGPWGLEGGWEGATRLNVWLKQRIENLVYRRCDRFIVLSNAFGHLLHRHYSVPKEKIHVISGGVDTRRFQCDLSRDRARSLLGWPQDRFVLFSPRRLVRRMGLENLLAALAEICSEIPDIWLAIAGRGPLREALEKQVAELGLGDRVRFLGFLSDDCFPLAYQAADLTVVPSQSLEGFGLVVLESLACGTPVLCTPVGGMPEILADFSPSSIADSAETDALARRLREAIAGEIDLPSRDACREYAVTHFDWPDIARRVRKVLLASQSS